MLAKHVVAVRMMVSLLPALLYIMPAASQSRSPGEPPDRVEQSKVPRAPVGHRQPTAADIPKERPKDAAQQAEDKRERELDAKLQICRGC